jgi:hypothetical protein
LPAPSLPDLFAASLGAITPTAGRDGPRLWVRRLIIWSEPGEVIRDISLRPGLNIIWSPDADADGNRMGHGGGKTSLCRLIRYCLGEDSFGSHDQRQLIGTALPNANVGAEVILDGQLWIVVRPIGNPRGRHLAQIGGVLDTAFQGEMPNTGISPLRQAIAQAIMPVAVPHMPVGSAADEGWEAALAWVSRDQECRLLDALTWRSPDTQSRSPSRNLSRAERLSVVRLLLNALQPAEIEAARIAQGHERAAGLAVKRRERIDWVRDDVGRGLADTFGGDPTEENVADLWSLNAKAVLEAEETKLDPDMEAKLKLALDAVAEKRTAVAKAETRLEVIDAELAGLSEIQRVLGNELPRAETRVRDAENPRCLACGQSIPVEAQEYIAQQIAIKDELAKERGNAEAKQVALRAEQDSLKFSVAADRQEFARREAAASTLQRTASDQTQRVSAAKGYVTMTARYGMYGAEIARVDKEIAKEQEAYATALRQVTELRRASQTVIARLSEHFDAVIRFLIPDGARGTVSLDDSGIHPRVIQHGNLTTAAVDSLKVVAFDLAALILTIEDNTQLPGFWLHDSPREADLGLHLYHRLFDLALMLERLGDTPLFQYIVTTTTEPPDELQGEPWLRLELRSAPQEQRLFRRDL